MEVKFNYLENEAEALDGKDKVGFCKVEDRDGFWEITHTVVNPAFGGKGLAGKLLDCVVAEAKKADKKIYPSCSYAIKKFDSDEKYKDIDQRLEQ